MATPGQPHPSVVMDRPARVRRTRGALGRAVCNRKGPTRPSAGGKYRGVEHSGRRADPRAVDTPADTPARGVDQEARPRTGHSWGVLRAAHRDAVPVGAGAGAADSEPAARGGGASAAAFRRRALREVGTLRRCPRRGPVPLARGRGTGPPRGARGAAPRPVASPPLPWGRGARPILAVASHL